MSSPLKIAIFGSGVVGLSSAYYILSSPLLPAGSTVTLIENSSSIAAGASSYAGGFIAGGAGGDAWQGAPSRDLARLSWECHLQLVGVLEGRDKYGWRECGAVGLRVGGGGEERSAYRVLPVGVKQVVDEDWLEGEREDMAGDGRGIGQLDPALFCKVMYAHLQGMGMKTIMGDATALGPRRLDGLRDLTLNLHGKATACLPKATSRSILSFSHFLISAGPWSAALCRTLSLPPIHLTNLPGHSLLIRPSPTYAMIPSEAVFAGIGGGELGVHAATSGLARALTAEEVSMGYTRSPELFPRSNGCVYVAGENSIPSTELEGADGILPNRLPDRADGVGKLLDQKLVGRLRRAAEAVSLALRVENGAIIEKEQICYRPITPDGESLIGELVPGVFVATGAGPWGITLAPGTGKVISEMLLAPAGTTPKLSADISKLGLSRFGSHL